MVNVMIMERRKFNWLVFGLLLVIIILGAVVYTDILVT